MSLTGEEGLICTSAVNNYDVPCIELHTGEQNFEFHDSKAFFNGNFYHVMEFQSGTQ